MKQRTVQLDEPSLISKSAPDESRWGFHQFPALTRLPDGRIIIMWADAEDASETHEGSPKVKSAETAEKPGCPSPDRPLPYGPISPLLPFLTANI
ncbi:MAG: hypothetical protein ACLFSE_15720 [Spirochaetia bacterium]